MSKELQTTSVPRFELTDSALSRLEKVAKLMASARIAIPKEFVGNEGDCFAIAMQADRWGLDPYVVAKQASVINGRLSYEGQLINAIVCSSGLIVGHFHYEWEGETKCRTGAVIRGDSEITWGNWVDANKQTTKNSPLWKTDPGQQLAYLAVKKWARLYTPAAIAGIYTPDEIREIPLSQEDVIIVSKEPTAPLSDRVKQAQEQEQIDTETGEVTDSNVTGEVTDSNVTIEELLSQVGKADSIQACNDLLAHKKHLLPDDGRRLHNAIRDHMKKMNPALNKK